MSPLPQTPRRSGLAIAAAAVCVAGCDYSVRYYRDAAAGASRDASESGDASGSTDGPGDADGCVCPSTFDPVCGTDGVTYTNACWATCAGIDADCGGTCPCATGFPCGGFGGQVCPPEYECLDDLSDGCEPAGGGGDCPGLCAPRDCAGEPGIPCPDGYECADDPSDGCDPAREPDCPAICVPTP